MIDLESLLLKRETIERFCREWNKKKGPKEMRASKSNTGDRIEIATSEPTGNEYVDHYSLVYDGIVILENEMENDLKKKKKAKK